MNILLCNEEQYGLKPVFPIPNAYRNMKYKEMNLKYRII